MKKIIYIMFCLIILSGCSTAQINTNSASQSTILDIKEEISQLPVNNEMADVLYTIAQTFEYTAEEIKNLYTNTQSAYLMHINEETNNLDNMKIVFDMFIDGKTDAEIKEWVLENLRKKIPEDTIKTLTHLSFDPIEIYFMSEDRILAILDDLKASNMPAGSRRLLAYEELASQVFNAYKDNSVEYNKTYEKAPEDYIFPEYIDWNITGFVQDETGYFNASVLSEDGKYQMNISISDFAYDNEHPFDSYPQINYISFYKIQ